jgi:aminoglycoside N3'-acetyltransferase
VKEVTQLQVLQALSELGVRAGDRLLVHSAVQFLGRPASGIGMYLAAIQQAIGTEGTLAVPAFNFAFARGEPYDPAATPSAGMGIFAEYVRRQPGAQRTLHPMQSLAVLGPLAGELAACDTLSAFDPGSAFECLLDHGFKILLLGANVNAVSLVHSSEQRTGVPYRYWKQFSGQVRGATGWQEKACRMYVRDLEIDPQLDLHPVQKLLEQENSWRSVALNYGRLSLCRAVDFVSAADRLLAEDPWALVSNRDAALDRYLMKSTLNFRG